MDEPFGVAMPAAWTSAVVFASPHSGADYPPDLMARSRLGAAEIRSSEDAFVDRLFSAAPAMGAPLLYANAPRAYVDLNRSRDELDPALIAHLPRQANNPRIASGLGVIPRVVANGRAIYDGKISRDEADKRLSTVWQPYHQRLQRLLQECHRRFGRAILIDCHSMPHEAIEAVSKDREGPDVVLGDRFGASSAQEVVDLLESAFRATGLSVARNAPFAGAYTAQAYGRPSRGYHVVQVEIDRALYMDEETIRPRADFHVMRSAVSHVIGELTAYGRDSGQALAAE